MPTWTLVLIHKLFELSGRDTRDLHEIWPSLEVFFHGGVSFKPYRKQFEQLIPSGRMTYFETYNASEGFFGLQNESAKDDLLLMLDYGIFYEFIRLEDLGNPFPKAYTIRQWVEDHKVCALYSCLFFVAFILFWVLASHRRCVILLLFRENRRHWPTISSASSLGCGSYFICPTTNCA